LGDRERGARGTPIASGPTPTGAPTRETDGSVPVLGLPLGQLHGLAGDDVLLAQPAAEVDELTATGAERAVPRLDGVVDGAAAVGAARVHARESNPVGGPGKPWARGARP